MGRSLELSRGEMGMRAGQDKQGGRAGGGARRVAGWLLPTPGGV